MTIIKTTMISITSMLTTMLLLLSLIIQGAESSSANVTFQIDWDDIIMLDGGNSNYQSAVVGDTVEFILNTSNTEAIFLHPNFPPQGEQDAAADATGITTTEKRGCNISAFVELVPISNSNSTMTDDEEEESITIIAYTFTQEDVYTEVVFASNITDDCEAEETVTFSVSPTASDRPTRCDDLSTALEECLLMDAGLRAPGRLACQTCLTTSVAGATVGLGPRACLGSSDNVCNALVGCPCGGTACAFEATVFGTCQIDSGRPDDCPITECSEEVAAEVSGAAYYSIGKGFTTFSLLFIASGLLMSASFF